MKPGIRAKMNTILRTTCVRKDFVSMLLSWFTQMIEQFKTSCSLINQ